MLQEANLWKLMGDFNLHGITIPGKVIFGLLHSNKLFITPIFGVHGILDIWMIP